MKKKREKTVLAMKHPPHPGSSIREDCLRPLGLSLTAGAKVLGVTRHALNNVINGKSGIRPEMAIRLSKAFGSTPETWLRMQFAFDMAVVRRNENKIRVKRQHVPLTRDSKETIRARAARDPKFRKELLREGVL